MKPKTRYRMRVVGLYYGDIQYSIEHRGWFGLWWSWRGACSTSKAKIEHLLTELRAQEEWDWWQSGATPNVPVHFVAPQPGQPITYKNPLLCPEPSKE